MLRKFKQLFLVSQEISKMQHESDNSCVMMLWKFESWKRLCLYFFLLEQKLKETRFHRILSTLGGFITYIHISWYTHGYIYIYIFDIIEQLLWYFSFVKDLDLDHTGQWLHFNPHFVLFWRRCCVFTLEFYFIVRI